MYIVVSNGIINFSLLCLSRMFTFYRMGLENIVLALIDADASPTEFTNSKGIVDVYIFNYGGGCMIYCINCYVKENFPETIRSHMIFIRLVHVEFVLFPIGPDCLYVYKYVLMFKVH